MPGVNFGKMKRIRFHTLADDLFEKMLNKSGLQRYNLDFEAADKLEKHPAFQAALKAVEEKYPDAVLAPKFNTGSETPVNFQIGKLYDV